MNIEDSTGQYIEIVGNGTSDSYSTYRANARTLDWSGNEIITGKMTATGFKTPTGSSYGFLKADGTIDYTNYKVYSAGTGIDISGSTIIWTPTTASYTDEDATISDDNYDSVGTGDMDLQLDGHTVVLRGSILLDASLTTSHYIPYFYFNGSNASWKPLVNQTIKSPATIANEIYIASGTTMTGKGFIFTISDYNGSIPQLHIRPLETINAGDYLLFNVS